MLARGHGGQPWVRQVAYNLARVNTLVAIGALSGWIGYSIMQTGPVWLIERILPLVAGSLMLVIGLEMLGIIGALTARWGRAVEIFVRRPLQDAMRSKSIGAPLALGVFNAFLPCQLVYAFAARAASTASVLEGMTTMLWFGLGTVPAMLAMGTISRLVPGLLRSRIVNISGLLVIVFAVITILRALGIPIHAEHGIAHAHH